MESADSHSWLLNGSVTEPQKMPSCTFERLLPFWVLTCLTSHRVLLIGTTNEFPRPQQDCTGGTSRKLRLSASRVHLNHSATGDIKVMFSDEIAHGVPTPILIIPSSRVPPLMKQPYFPTCLMYISPSISSLSSVAMASCSSFSTALSLMTGLPYSHHYQLQRTCPPIWRIPGRSGKLLNCLSRYSTS